MLSPPRKGRARVFPFVVLRMSVAELVQQHAPISLARTVAPKSKGKQRFFPSCPGI